MFGNGLEEFLIKNPEDTIRREGWQLAIYVMIITWVVGLVVFSQVDFSPLPTKLIAILVIVSGVGLGATYRWFFFSRTAKKHALKKKALELAYRDNLAAEQEKQIASAKAAGKFKRWR